MSGRKQHHFWQVIQRGFGEERKQGFTNVFAYFKGKNPIEVGTRNFGAERDFFCFSRDLEADTLITSLENSLQGLVKKLQAGYQVESDQFADISRLISHLENRTKFLREHLIDTSVVLLEELNRWFLKPTLFRKMMKRYARENRGEIEKLVDKNTGDPRLSSVIVDFLIENFDQISESVRTEAATHATLEMRNLRDKTVDHVKRAHIKSFLEKQPNPIREERYRNLTYRIRSGFNGLLICPDTMTSFLTARKPKPFFDLDDELEAIFVPLTSDLLLIGEKDQKIERSNETIFRILASTSYSSFIAKSDTPELRALSSRIGSNAEILTSADISSIKRQTIESLI